MKCENVIKSLDVKMKLKQFSTGMEIVTEFHSIVSLFTFFFNVIQVIKLFKFRLIMWQKWLQKMRFVN